MGGAVLEKLWGELCFIHVSDPFTEVFNVLLCGMFSECVAEVVFVVQSNQTL